MALSGSLGPQALTTSCQGALGCLRRKPVELPSILLDSSSASVQQWQATYKRAQSCARREQWKKARPALGQFLPTGPRMWHPRCRLLALLWVPSIPPRACGCIEASQAPPVATALPKDHNLMCSEYQWSGQRSMSNLQTLGGIDPAWLACLTEREADVVFFNTIIKPPRCPEVQAGSDPPTFVWDLCHNLKWTHHLRADPNVVPTLCPHSDLWLSCAELKLQRLAVPRGPQAGGALLHKG